VSKIDYMSDTQGMFVRNMYGGRGNVLRMGGRVVCPL